MVGPLHRSAPEAHQRQRPCHRRRRRTQRLSAPHLGTWPGRGAPLGRAAAGGRRQQLLPPRCPHLNPPAVCSRDSKIKRPGGGPSQAPRPAAPPAPSRCRRCPAKGARETTSPPLPRPNRRWQAAIHRFSPLAVSRAAPPLGPPVPLHAAIPHIACPPTPRRLQAASHRAPPGRLGAPPPYAGCHCRFYLIDGLSAGGGRSCVLRRGRGKGTKINQATLKRQRGLM